MEFSIQDKISLSIDAIDVISTEVTNELSLYYKKLWDIDHKPISNKNVICGGKDGNCIAVMEKPIIERESHVITLYDHKLKPVNQITISGHFSTAFMHLLLNGHLLILTSNDQKQAKLYEYFSCNLIRQSSFETSGTIRFCRMWDNGCCFITEDQTVYYLPNYEVTEKPPPLLKFSCNIQSFEAMNPIYKESRTNSTTKFPIVYGAGNDGNLYVAGQSTNGDLFNVSIPIIQDPETSASANIVNMVLNCTCDLLLVLFDDQTVKVFQSDLSGCILEFGIWGIPRETIQMFGWLSDDIPMITTDTNIYLYDGDGTSYDIKIDHPLVIPLTTSALVFSNDSLHILGSVNDSVKNCLTEFTAPYKLCIAFDENNYTKVSELDFNLFNLEKNALLECLKAAQECTFNKEYQRYFIAVATFTLNYLQNSFDVSKEQQDLKAQIHKELNTTIDVLRFCNNMQADLNLYSDFLGAFKLWKTGGCYLRYCSFNLYSKAMEIAALSKHKKSFVVTEWCRCVMNSVSNDDDVIKIFSTKVDHHFNAADVCEVALQLERNDLACKIVELERYPPRIIPFLLKQKLYEQALSCAVSSLDSSDIMRVFEYTLYNIGESEIKSIISNNPDLYFMLYNLFSTVQNEQQSYNQNMAYDKNQSDNWKKYASIIRNAKYTKETIVIDARNNLHNLQVIENVINFFDGCNSQFTLPYLQHGSENLKTLKKFNDQQESLPVKVPFNKLLLEKAHRNIEDAIQLAEDLKSFKRERSIMIIARGFAHEGKWEKYNALAEKQYTSQASFLVALSFQFGGREKCHQFIEKLQVNDKNKANYFEQLDTWDPPEKEDGKSPPVPQWGTKEVAKSYLFK